jgi:hypothetical protein
VTVIVTVTMTVTPNHHIQEAEAMTGIEVIMHGMGTGEGVEVGKEKGIVDGVLEVEWLLGVRRAVGRTTDVECKRVDLTVR